LIGITYKLPQVLSIATLIRAVSIQQSVSN